MFVSEEKWEILKKQVDSLQKVADELKDTHHQCHYCYKIGHTKDMEIKRERGLVGGYNLYYHLECYEKLFNVKPNPTYEQKWLPNEKKGAKNNDR